MRNKNPKTTCRNSAKNMPNTLPRGMSTFQPCASWAESLPPPGHYCITNQGPDECGQMKCAALCAKQDGSECLTNFKATLDVRKMWTFMAVFLDPNRCELLFFGKGLPKSSEFKFHEINTDEYWYIMQWSWPFQFFSKIRWHHEISGDHI